MKTKYKHLAIEQLDQMLIQLAALKSLSMPPKGWIRAIRNALGMSGKQLAKRIGVNQQRIARMERDEPSGKVTVKTLRAAAKAMDCVFVYGLVPQESLRETIRKQAQRIAKKQSARSNQLMRLEDQELDQNEKEKALKDLVEEIIRTMPKTLWDK